MMGDKDWQFPDPLQHHPVNKLQEGRQEDIAMGDRHRRLARMPGSTIRFSWAPELRQRIQEEIIMGDWDWQFPGTAGSVSRFEKQQESRQEEIMMGDKDRRFPGTPGRRKGLAIPRDPLLRAQERISPAAPSGFRAPELEERDKRISCTGRETRGYYDGRQRLAISRNPRQYHPVNKLQEETQQNHDARQRLAISRPAEPSPSQATSRETRGDYDGKLGPAFSWDCWRRNPINKLQEGRQEDFMIWGQELAISRDTRQHNCFLCKSRTPQ